MAEKQRCSPTVADERGCDGNQREGTDSYSLGFEKREDFLLGIPEISHGERGEVDGLNSS